MATAQFVSCAPRSGGSPGVLFSAAVLCFLLAAYRDYAFGDLAIARSGAKLLVGLGVSMLIIGCARAPRHRIARLLSTPALRTVGVMCFSLYVWHEPVRVVTGRYSVADLDGVALNAALLALLALISYRYIEFGHIRSWRSLFPVF